MINKLLLVRTPDVDSTLTERAGISGFIKGSPVAIRPSAKSWSDEQISHWGFILEGMKVSDLQKLLKWVAEEGEEGVTLHDYDGDLTKALANVGLQVNKAA
jgi:hypothetical protein